MVVRRLARVAGAASSVIAMALGRIFGQTGDSLKTCFEEALECGFAIHLYLSSGLI